VPGLVDVYYVFSIMVRVIIYFGGLRFKLVCLGNQGFCLFQCNEVPQ
jgi:hypothetical protein